MTRWGEGHRPREFSPCGCGGQPCEYTVAVRLLPVPLLHSPMTITKFFKAFDEVRMRPVAKVEIAGRVHSVLSINRREQRLAARIARGDDTVNADEVWQAVRRIVPTLTDDDVDTMELHACGAILALGGATFRFEGDR